MTPGRPGVNPDQRTVPAAVAIDLTSLDLPRLYTPAEAVEILRQLGLPEMTECALRTRAYRRQVPFHFNGHRIRFTVTDLREIAEGRSCRPGPSPAADSLAELPVTASTASRRQAAARSIGSAPADAWRARTPRTPSHLETR